MRMNNFNIYVDDPRNGAQRIYIENKSPKEIVSEIIDDAAPKVLKKFDIITPAVFKRKRDKLWHM